MYVSVISLNIPHIHNIQIDTRALLNTKKICNIIQMDQVLLANDAEPIIAKGIPSNHLRCISHMRHHGFMVENRNIIPFFNIICDDPDTFFQFKPTLKSPLSQKNELAAVSQGLGLFANCFPKERFDQLQLKLSDAIKSTRTKAFPCSVTTPLITAMRFDTCNQVPNTDKEPSNVNHIIVNEVVDDDKEKTDDQHDECSDDDLPMVNNTGFDMHAIDNSGCNVNTGFEEEIVTKFYTKDVAKHIKEIIQRIDEQHNKTIDDLKEQINKHIEKNTTLQNDLTSTKSQLVLAQRKNPSMTTFNRAFDTGKDMFQYVLSIQQDISQTAKASMSGLLTRVFDQINNSITENR